MDVWAANKRKQNETWNGIGSIGQSYNVNTEAIERVGALIEQLQRKMKRMLLRVSSNRQNVHHLSYESRLRELDLLKLKERRVLSSICLMVKLLNSPDVVPSLNAFIFVEYYVISGNLKYHLKRGII